MQGALLMMIVGMSLIPTGDTAGKLLVGNYGVTPLVVAWARFMLGALIAWLIAPAGTYKMLLDWRVWGRGLALGLGVTSILTALETAPITSVFAAFFVGPILSVVFSAWWLQERIPPQRAALLAIGFMGVLLVVRPGFEAPPGIGYAVVAGLFYGVYLTSSRALSHYPPRGLLATQMLPGAFILMPFALGSLPAMTPEVGGLFVVSGLASMLGNLLLILAYARAPATVLAPMVYFQLVAATLLGWIFFSDLPDSMTTIGTILVAGAGIASATMTSPNRPGTDRS
jgi:drug/metabolite transporter (DMT)-like permease